MTGPSGTPGPSRPAWIVVGTVGVLALVVVAFVLWPQPGPAAGEETRSMEQGEVTVTATRTGGPASGPVTFHVLVDTHVVDLSDFDPVAAAALDTPHGTLRPTQASEVVKNDGHHVEARLVFDAAPGEAEALVLHDLAGRAEWRLVFA